MNVGLLLGVFVVSQSNGTSRPHSSGYVGGKPLYPRNESSKGAWNIMTKLFPRYNFLSKVEERVLVLGVIGVGMIRAF